MIDRWLARQNLACDRHPAHSGGQSPWDRSDSQRVCSIDNYNVEYLGLDIFLEAICFIGGSGASGKIQHFFFVPELQLPKLSVQPIMIMSINLNLTGETRGEDNECDAGKVDKP